MKWKKIKPLNKEGHIGCLNCGGTPKKLSMRTKIIIGFGDAVIKKNGEIFYFAPPDLKWENAKTLQSFENIAKKDPDNDWRCIFNLPLRYGEYQRQDINNWVLIKTGIGFA